MEACRRLIERNVHIRKPTKIIPQTKSLNFKFALISPLFPYFSVVWFEFSCSSVYSPTMTERGKHIEKFDSNNPRLFPLETSFTYAQYQRTGKFVPPATTLPHFKTYTVDDFHFLTVLGTGSFGKVSIHRTFGTFCLSSENIENALAPLC